MRLRSMTSGGDGSGIDDGHASPVADDRTIGELTGGVGQIRIGAFAQQFRRNLRWAVPLLLAGMAGAYYMTKDIERSWTGEGRVLAQISSEYVYDPVAGQGNPGLLLTPEHIVLNEVAIMTSPAVTTRVLEQLALDYGLSRVEPGMSARVKAGQSPAANADLLRSFEKRFIAMPQAKSSVIDIAFKHSDPEIAVAGLNAYITAYTNARKELFVSNEVERLALRREATEQQLAQNESSIAALYRRNGISDYNSEREGATERTEGLKAELNALRATLTETETALMEVEDQLRATDPTIDLFVDDRASQRVAQAELELKQLLAKYLPTSDPVRQKQTEIAELRSLLSANGGRAAGGRRVGPNPVHQELTNRRNTLAATANSLREKEVVVQNQLNSADGKTRKLRDLSPQVENLIRERDTLQARLRSLNAREQEAIINKEQAQGDFDNVRVIARADTARKGRNMAAILFLAMSVVWAGVVALLTLMVTFFGDIYARPGPHRRDSVPGGRRANDSFVPPIVPEPVQPYVPPSPEAPREPAVAETPPQLPVYAHEPASMGAVAQVGHVPAAYDFEAQDVPVEPSPSYPQNPYATASLPSDESTADYHSEGPAFTAPSLPDTGFRSLYERPPTL